MSRTELAAIEARFRRAAEQKDVDERERCAAMTPAEKWAELDALCRDGQRLARLAGREAAVAAYRDPLPQRSLAILAMLRDRARQRSAG